MLLTNQNMSRIFKKSSVVIITRNRAHSLERCLLSLVSQTCLPNEVILVDNASSDSTRKVASYFREHLPIRYLYEKRLGIPQSRNTGLKNAKGDLVLMLDDDCRASEDWVEKMVEAHHQHLDVWAVQGLSLGIPRKRVFSVLADFNRYLSLKGRSGNQFPSPTEFLARDFNGEFFLSTIDTRNFSFKFNYLKQNNLSFDERFYRGSDSDFGRQICQKGGLILFSPRIIVKHWERDKLSYFLEQRWHIGRTAVRLEKKWGLPQRPKASSSLKKLESFLAFCFAKKAVIFLPILIPLFFLDRLYHLNGTLYERGLLKTSFEPQN